MERERERERKRETTRKKEKGGEREREKEKETHIHLAKERQIETERYNRDLSCCSPRVDHPEVEATTCLKIQQPRKPKENKQFIILHNHGDSSCLMLISKNRFHVHSGTAPVKNTTTQNPNKPQKMNG